MRDPAAGSDLLRRSRALLRAVGRLLLARCPRWNPHMATEQEKFACYTRPVNSIGKQKQSQWRSEPAFSFDGGATRAKAEKVSLTHNEVLKLPTTLFQPGLKNVAYLGPQNSIGAQTQSKHRNEPRILFGTQSKLDKLTVKEEHRLAADNMAKKEQRYVQHLAKEAAVYYGGGQALAGRGGRDRSPSQHRLDRSLGLRIDHLPAFMQSVANANARAIQEKACGPGDPGEAAIRAALARRTPPRSGRRRPGTASTCSRSRGGADREHAGSAAMRRPSTARSAATTRSMLLRSARSNNAASCGAGGSTERRTSRPSSAHPSTGGHRAGSGRDATMRARPRSGRSARSRHSARSGRTARSGATDLLGSRGSMAALGGVSAEIARQLEEASAALKSGRSQLDNLCRSVERLELAVPPQHAWTVKARRE